MKIIHCADLHLDSKMESNLEHSKAMQRRDELLDTFDEMVAYAVREDVRVILIAGDLFDKPNVRRAAKNRVMEQILSHSEIDFCYLRGNHDQSDFIEDLMAQGDLPNLRLFGTDGWTSYSYDEGRIVITGMELAKENVQTIGANLVLDQDRCNIVTLHGQESDYQGSDRTEIINLSLLRGKHIDYLALGHIHSYKYERLDDRGYYCYSGCLEGRGFDECGKKGFVLLDVDGETHKVMPTFVPVAKRSLHEVYVEIDPSMDMMQIVAKASECAAWIPHEDMIKLILTGKIRMDMDIDEERLKRQLADDYFYVKVNNQTSIQVDYESFRNDRSLKGEFVRLLEEQEMSEEQRAAIIELGMKAILGEDLEV